MTIISTWMNESACTIPTNALGAPLSRYLCGRILNRLNNEIQRTFSFSEAHHGVGTYVTGGHPTLLEAARALKCP